MLLIVAACATACVVGRASSAEFSTTATLDLSETIRLSDPKEDRLFEWGEPDLDVPVLNTPLLVRLQLQLDEGYEEDMLHIDDIPESIRVDIRFDPRQDLRRTARDMFEAAVAGRVPVKEGTLDNMVEAMKSVARKSIMHVVRTSAANASAPLPHMQARWTRLGSWTVPFVTPARAQLSVDITSGWEWKGESTRRLKSYVSDDSWILDIGAHLGERAIPLIRGTSPSTKVVAVDAIRTSLDILQVNARLANVSSQVIPLHAVIVSPSDALANGTWSVPAWDELLAARNAAKTSRLAVADAGDYSHTNLDASSFLGKRVPRVGVPTLTMDEVVFGPSRLRPPSILAAWNRTVLPIQASVGRCPSLVKVHVNGFESALLRGARRLLARCRPVLVLPATHKEPAAPMLRQLAVAGYRVVWDVEPKGRHDDRFSDGIHGTLLARSRDAAAAARDAASNPTGARRSLRDRPTVADPWVQASITAQEEWVLDWLAVPVQRRVSPGRARGIHSQWDEVMLPVDGSPVGVEETPVAPGGHRSWVRRLKEWWLDGIPVVGAGPESGVEPYVDETVDLQQDAKRASQMTWEGRSAMEAFLPGLTIWSDGVENGTRAYRLHAGVVTQPTRRRQKR